MKMESTKIDKNSHLRQYNENYFETYERKKTKPFKDIGEIIVLMSKLVTKADKLDFKIMDFKVSKKVSGCNMHYGLFPGSDYNFSGGLELENKESYKNKPHLHDTWRITVYNNGEIISGYNKWDRMPESPKQQKEFMKKHSIDRLLK